MTDTPATAAPARPLPSALGRLDDILPHDGRTPAVFLDYDGTLSPIVSRPEDAWLSASMRATLERLSERCRLAILSGRDLGDVRGRVDLEHLWYAGSHGFDIAGPDGQHMEYAEGRRFLPLLDSAETALGEALRDVDGCQVERKRFAIAVHYRRVAERAVAEVQQQLARVRDAHPGLRLSGGKKVFELQPDIVWHKGQALRWLLATLTPEQPTLALYIGDDATDEDAFAELVDSGVGILVSEVDRPTLARYRLEDPDHVEQFLNRLADQLPSATAPP